MRRRDVLRKAGIGLTVAIGATGLAAARPANQVHNVDAQDHCGPCEDHYCWCNGEWYDCGHIGGDCCDGPIECGCTPNCECGGGHCA